MTPLPDGRRPASTWIVIGVVAVLAVLAILLAVNLLNNLPSGSGATPTESTRASASSGVSGTPLASSSASSTPTEPSVPGWSDTGSMIGARAGHTATRLLDGTVLVAGGSTGASGTVATSAELYDPVTGSWSATGNMKEGRWSHSATLLLDGRVLVVGGISNISGSDVFLARELARVQPASSAASDRVRAILAKMTLREKVGQLTQLTLEAVTTPQDQMLQLDPVKLRRAVVDYGTGSMSSGLTDLARWTGGDIFIAIAPAHTSIAARQIVSEMRHQYMLAFEASSRPGWRPLEIRARGRDFVVRARSGYTAGGGAPPSEAAKTSTSKPGGMD